MFFDCLITIHFKNVPVANKLSMAILALCLLLVVAVCQNAAQNNAIINPNHGYTVPVDSIIGLQEEKLWQHVCSNFSGYDQWTKPSWLSFPGKVYHNFGYDKSITTDVLLDDCKKLCWTVVPNCFAIEFDTETRDCWTHNDTSVLPNGVAPYQTISTSFLKTRCGISGKGNICDFDWSDGLDRDVFQHGGRLIYTPNDHKPTTSLDDCQWACTLDDSCKGVIFSKTEGCFLISDDSQWFNIDVGPVANGVPEYYTYSLLRLNCRPIK